MELAERDVDEGSGLGLDGGELTGELTADDNVDVDVDGETEVRCTGGSNTRFTIARVTAIWICWFLETLTNVSVTDFRDCVD